MNAEKLSLPKDKIRVLLLEGINDSAVALMQAAGYTNLVRLPKALDREALHEALQGVHMVGIRSRTQMDAAAFEAADRLLAVGCFSVGPIRWISKPPGTGASRSSTRPSRTRAPSPS